MALPLLLFSHELGFFLRDFFLLFYRYIKIKMCQSEIFTVHIHRARGSGSHLPVTLNSDTVSAVGGGELARGKGVCGESEKVSQFLGMQRECLLLSEVLQLN